MPVQSNQPRQEQSGKYWHMKCAHVLQSTNANYPNTIEGVLARLRSEIYLSARKTTATEVVDTPVRIADIPAIEVFETPAEW